MRKNYPDSVANLLSNNEKVKNCTPLLKISQQAMVLIKLNHVIGGLLPTVLRPWCRVVNIRQDVIILEIASASWKMSLLYGKDQLLSEVRKKISPSLSSINIKINPQLMRTWQPSTRNKDKNNHRQKLQHLRQTLSTNSAKCIRNVAIRSEGKLKKILDRFAKLAIDSTASSPSDDKMAL